MVIHVSPKELRILHETLFNCRADYIGEEAELVGKMLLAFENIKEVKECQKSKC